VQWRRVLSGVAAGAFSLAVLTSLTACGGTTSSARALAGSRPKDVVVARVNGNPIRWQDVARRIQMLKLAAPAQASHLGGEALADEVRTELIDEALVVDAARRAHLSVGAKEVAADTARLMREFVPGLYPTRAAFRAALHRLGLTEGDLRAYVAQTRPLKNPARRTGVGL